MDLIRVTGENLAKEHICCDISKESDPQVLSKKAWLAGRFADGLVFLKADVRGKCFIEYLPAEKAWCPSDAPGYLFINCLWGSGQWKGQGLSNRLMDACIEDGRGQGRLGLAVLSSKKKLPYLSDPGYLRHRGFLTADTAGPYELLYLPFTQGAQPPRFKDCARALKIGKPGIVLYCTHQCPFIAKYVPLVEEAAREHGLPIEVILLESAEQAQSAPAPFTTYSLFYDGAFVTNEIMSHPKFEKFLAQNGLTGTT